MAYNPGGGGGVTVHNQLSGRTDAGCHSIDSTSGLQTALAEKVDVTSLAQVAITGDYVDLSNKPVLFNGSYASLSGVPATFPPVIGAGAAQACAGNDSRLSDARTPLAHTQTAVTISDSTATGRALITATDAAAARTAIGAGTSSFSGSYPDLTNKPTVPVIASARTTLNRTTTATGMANITDLAFPVLAGETWSFECYLRAGCSSTGGSQFSATVPAGATVNLMVDGNTTAATAWTAGIVTASDGASPTMLNANAQNRCVNVTGIVVNGANAGAVQMRFKSVTSGQTTTVNANSYLTARKH